MPQADIGSAPLESGVAANLVIRLLDADQPYHARSGQSLFDN